MYQKPAFGVRRIFNPLLSLAVKLGASPRGAQILAVRGRKTGEWRTMPVNPLTHNGDLFLVAPRGETHWVRNVRAGGEAKLRRGHTETPITLEEVSNEEKVGILRAYLKVWAAETKRFFGLEKDASDEDLAQIAPNHPAFRIKPVNQR